MSPDINAYTHVVPSDASAGLLIRSGARRDKVRHNTDRLTVGPCDADPDRHLELRRAWSTQSDSIAFGRGDLSGAMRGERPVVIWATTAYADLVWLWWVLDCVERIPIDPGGLMLARPTVADAFLTMSDATPEDVHAALERAAEVSKDVLRDGAALWRQFASPSPLAFDDARRRGTTAFPDLAESTELHGAWFPRRAAGYLSLAEADEALLTSLSATPRTPSELFPRVPGITRLIAGFGSITLLDRLRAWSGHGVIARDSRDEQNPFCQDVFTATDRTEVVVKDGLRGVADAPPLYVGGCLVNDPQEPWVRVFDDSWRITRDER
jgi:hypothetical protein